MIALSRGRQEVSEESLKDIRGEEPRCVREFSMK